MSKDFVLTCRRERGTPLENVEAASKINSTALNLLDMIRLGAEHVDRVAEKDKDAFGLAVFATVNAAQVLLEELDELLLSTRVASERRPLMPTEKQLGMLHVAKKQLGLDDETYRVILKRKGGVESAKDLSRYGYDEVLTEMKRLGFKPTAAVRGFGRRPGMASPEQIGLIRSLWAEWVGGEDPEKGLNAWLERSYHVSALRFLPADKAGKSINGLRAMLRRKTGRRRTIAGRQTPKGNAMRDQVFSKFRLTAKETRLLARLAKASPNAVSREALTAAVYADGAAPKSDRIPSLVCGLRKKLAAHGVAIETKRGKGYRLSAEMAARAAAIGAPAGAGERREAVPILRPRKAPVARADAPLRLPPSFSCRAADCGFGTGCRTSFVAIRWRASWPRSRARGAPSPSRSNSRGSRTAASKCVPDLRPRFAAPLKNDRRRRETGGFFHSRAAIVRPSGTDPPKIDFEGD